MINGFASHTNKLVFLPEQRDAARRALTFVTARAETRVFQVTYHGPFFFKLICSALEKNSSSRTESSVTNEPSV